MSAPLAASAVNTNRTKVIGMGLTLKAGINRELLGMTSEAAKEWQRKTEAEFALWADNRHSCDATGMNNFAGMQQLALLSWLQSGDVFAVVKRRDVTRQRPYSLRLHLVEADRVRTPDAYGGVIIGPMTNGRNPENGNRIFDGVEVDDDGLAVAYYVHNTYPWQITSEPTTWQRVEAIGPRTGMPNILHIMSSERPDQYRGVTYLAQVIEPLLQLRRYTEASLTAAIIQSFFTAWVVTKTDPTQIPVNEVGGGNIAGIPSMNPVADNISLGQREYEMGPGQVIHLSPDEDIKFGDPNIPAAGIDAFVKTFCQQVGAALGLPYEVLLKTYNSSYSASRAALLEAWEEFRMRRAWFVSDFCQPVYEIWLAEAVARGRVSAPGFFADPLIRAAWCGARWIGPVQGQLDPLKEANAAVVLTGHAFKTHEQVALEMGGGDWAANVDQLADANAKLALARSSGTTPERTTPAGSNEDEETEENE